MKICGEIPILHKIRHKHQILYIRIYEGYPEGKFRWAIKKKIQEYITNHVYCHLMYIPYTISSSYSERIRFDSCSLYPQNEIGPSVSSSVVLCVFVLLVYIVVLVSHIYTKHINTVWAERTVVEC